MKDAILKYYGRMLLGLLPVFIFSPMSNSFNLINYLKAVLFCLVFLLIVAFMLAILEVKVFRRYYDNLIDKLTTLSEREKESSRLTITKIGKYDLLIRINEETNLPIEFHIPKKQIDKMKHPPNFKYKESSTDKTSTYLVETSSSFFMKRNMKRVRKEIEKVVNYK